MAYLRKKGNYWSLVEGGRDPETGKVKQKVLKYYGAEKPSEDQVVKDKAALGTTNKTAPAKASKPRSSALGTTNLETKLGTTGGFAKIYTSTANLRAWAKLYSGYALAHNGTSKGVIEHGGKSYVVIGVTTRGALLTPLHLLVQEVTRSETPNAKSFRLVPGDVTYYIISDTIMVLPEAQTKPKDAFDIDSRVSHNNLKTVIGTVWRNNHTEDLLTPTAITESEYRKGEFEIWDDLDDPDHTSAPVWCKLAQKWKNAFEHWYRVDNLPPEAQKEAFCRRIGYCREAETHARKEFNKMRTLPVAEQKKDSCYTSNLNLRKQDLEWAENDLSEALKQYELHQKGVKYEKLRNLSETKEAVHVQGDQGEQAPIQQEPGHT